MISLEHSTELPEAPARTSLIVKVFSLIGYIGLLASMVASMIYIISVSQDGSEVAVQRAIAVIVFYLSTHVASHITVRWYYARKDAKDAKEGEIR